MVIYIHIPFCIKKCDYCDFLSGSYNENIRNEYIKCLINEIKYYGEIYGRAGRNIPVTSVFFGGGTPSMLDGKNIALILDILREQYNIEESAEITVECNPGTLNREKLIYYKNAGVNRLSIGLQSANDEELKSVGRIHTYKEFLEGYHMARELGFANVNIDLMSALPGQTLSSYRETLEKIVELEPEHISAYSLILEEGTRLYDRINELEAAGKDTGLPDEDTEREMYYLTKEILGRAGYKRYEISNYAKAGYSCKHNKAYWKRDNYLGMGLGASSCMDDIRTKNVDDLKEYMKRMSGNASEIMFQSPVDKQETIVLSEEDKMAEYMFLGLRMMEGVSGKHFSNCFGKDYGTIYGGMTDKLIEQNLIKLSEDGDRICLTELGIDVSNTVLAQFLPD